jgi:hypothetical protein
VVALNPAGIIPFHSELPTIDVLGLNDVHIAHEGKRDRKLRFGHQAGDGDYVLSNKPAVILFGSTTTQKATGFISDREIAANSKFKRGYAGYSDGYRLKLPRQDAGKPTRFASYSRKA